MKNKSILLGCLLSLVACSQVMALDRGVTVNNRNEHHEEWVLKNGFIQQCEERNKIYAKNNTAASFAMMTPAAIASLPWIIKVIGLICICF